jgi:hypothetical protein
VAHALHQLAEVRARFVPHGYPYLRVSAAANVGPPGGRAPAPFGHARVALPLEFARGVLAGALQEPDLVGPGELIFDHAAVHEIDSTWEVFRLLATGVVRLLGLPPASGIPVDLLPRFGGYEPAPLGSG